MEYLRNRDIRWLVDFGYWIEVVFGRYMGEGAEYSLDGTGVIKDSIYVMNSIYLVQVLPEGQRPLPQYTLRFEEFRKMGYQWGKIPIPFLKKE